VIELLRLQNEITSNQIIEQKNNALFFILFLLGEGTSRTSLPG